MKEQNLTTYGLIDTKEAIQVGKLSGAKLIIAGNILNVNAAYDYSLNLWKSEITADIKIINVETAKLEMASNFRELDVADRKFNIADNAINATLEKIVAKFNRELNEEQILPKEILNSITFDTIRGSNTNLKEITEDLYLPTNVNNKVKIEWVLDKNSNSNLINTKTGKVTRDAEDTFVNLKAIATLGKEKEEKIFPLIIKSNLYDWEIANGNWYINKDTKRTIGKFEGKEGERGQIVYKIPTKPSYKMDVTVERLSQDAMKYIEVNFLGGKFCINGMNQWYFYENSENRTDPVMDYNFKDKENKVSIIQENRKIITFINNQKVGEFTLANEPKIGKLSISFTAEKYQEGKIAFRDFNLIQK